MATYVDTYQGNNPERIVDIVSTTMSDLENASWVRSTINYDSTKYKDFKLLLTDYDSSITKDTPQTLYAPVFDTIASNLRDLSNNGDYFIFWGGIVCPLILSSLICGNVLGPANNK